MRSGITFTDKFLAECVSTANAFHAKPVSICIERKRWWFEEDEIGRKRKIKDSIYCTKCGNFYPTSTSFKKAHTKKEGGK